MTQKQTFEKSIFIIIDIHDIKTNKVKNDQNVITTFRLENLSNYQSQRASSSGAITL